MPQKVLVIAPHPDDEAIGCGGAICLHRQRGDTVDVVFLTSGERGIPGVPPDEVCALREAEAAAAGAVLGIRERTFLHLSDMGLIEETQRGAALLAPILAAQVPDLVYLPHAQEAHPDHQAAIPIVRAALSRLARPAELRAYELWTPMAKPGWVEVISDVMRQKLRAVRCYRSQLRQCRYDRAIRGLNQYRGVMMAHSQYAEAFQFVESG